MCRHLRHAAVRWKFRLVRQTFALCDRRFVWRALKFRWLRERGWRYGKRMKSHMFN